MSVCKHCNNDFLRFDHKATRPALFCCHKCFLEYYRKVCIECGDDSIPHRKYWSKARGILMCKRRCKLCERDVKNEYQREYYKRTKIRS